MEPLIPYTEEAFRALFESDTPENALAHVGKPHDGPIPHSGRYAWGSGTSPFQRSLDFVTHYEALRKSGMTDKQIAEADGLTLNQLRARKSNSNADVRHHNVAVAMKLKDAGWSTTAIGRKFGVNESTVRGWLDAEVQKRKDASRATANMLADQVKEFKFVEVGKGVEQHLGVTTTKLSNAIELLKDSGQYEVQTIRIDQGAKGKKTQMQVLVPAGTERKEIYDNKDKIAIPNKGVYSEDSGATWNKVEAPVPIDLSRVFINYTSSDMQRGGVLKDGVIEIRPGVEDLSLGKAKYAQVRIRVGEDKYMKGMAVYSDNIPKGYDIVYNTNKTEAQASKVFKTMNKDKDGNIDLINPFGATIKTNDSGEHPDLIKCQRHYIDPKTGERKLSAINVVNEEGNWKDWSRTLSAQVLSKQEPYLAKRQLKIMYDRKVDEFNEILGLTNPTIKAHLLEGFADDCDSEAVHLKAAAITGSASHVIIPIESMKPTEIYAPNYDNGTRVALIRYPHAGRFEIAELTVNNLNREARRVLGTNAPDAVGIHHSVAAKLSGADFDGDTVLVIPNNSGDIKSAPSLKGLTNYEPKVIYAKSDDQMKTGKPKNKKDMYDENGKQLYDNFDTQLEMGKITNLITDMQIKHAPIEDVCFAVRHSMTVIDAEKHNLDHKRSYEENHVAELKRKYQGVNPNGMLKGSSTLISLAKSKVHQPETKAGVWVPDPTGRTKGHRQLYDPETGERLWSPTGKMRSNKAFDKEGNFIGYTKTPVLEQKTRMYLTNDAYSLSSGSKIEGVYADHANRMKSLANQARKEIMATVETPYNPSAAKRYSDEIASLKAKKNAADKYKPIGRRVGAVVNSMFQMKAAEDPSLWEDHDRAKKERARLTEYVRNQIGEKRPVISFTDKEYEAIQAGAVSKTFLRELIKECDQDALKQRAMPRQWKSMSPTKIARARQMIKNGATQIEVAQALGVSTSTLYDALNSK